MLTKENFWIGHKKEYPMSRYTLSCTHNRRHTVGYGMVNLTHIQSFKADRLK